MNKSAEVQEANKMVLVELGKKRPSSHHDPELRTRIGRFAASSGNKAAVDKINTRKRWADQEVKALFVA